MAFRLHEALGTQEDVVSRLQGLRPTRSRTYASATALPRSPQGSLPAWVGWPLTGRGSHPLDDTQGFMTYSSIPLDRPAWPHHAPRPIGGDLFEYRPLDFYGPVLAVPVAAGIVCCGAAVRDNRKFPICGNRKPHTLVVGGDCPAFHDVDDVNIEGAGHRCTDGRRERQIQKAKAAGLILCTDCVADRVEHRAIIREMRISWDRCPVCERRRAVYMWR